jgi:hypothetical protein
MKLIDLIIPVVFLIIIIGAVIFTPPKAIYDKQPQIDSVRVESTKTPPLPLPEGEGKKDRED